MCLSPLIFLNNVDELLICPICELVLCPDSVQDDDEHMYCEKCINAWLEKNTVCPVCDQEIEIGNLKPIPNILKKLIRNFDVNCKFRYNGCEEVITVSEIENHEKECGYDICDQCDCFKTQNHNCIEELKKKINYLKIQQKTKTTEETSFQSTGFGGFGRGTTSSNSAIFGFGAQTNTTEGFKQLIVNPLLSGGSLFSSSTPQQQPSSGFSSGFSFGQSTAAAPTVNGTTVKFTPLSGSDQAVKKNVTQTVNTLHQCITAMKEYESKSIEELRFEDYQAKRKFAQQTGFGTSLFGGGTQQTTTGGLFGSTGLTQSTSTTGFGGSSNLFGSQAKPTTSLFGLATTTAAPTTSIFGSTTANKPLFGSTTATSTTGTGFGSTGFGGFGSGTTTTSAPSSSIFGGGTTSFGTFNFCDTPTATMTTSTPLFGTTTPTASTVKPTFGGFSFGGFSSTFGSNTGGFGKSTSVAAPSPFGTTTTTQAQQKLFFSGLGSNTNVNDSFSTQYAGFGATTTTSSPSLFNFTQPAGTIPSANINFGASPAATTTTSTSLFRFSLVTTANKPLFGSTLTTTTASSGIASTGLDSIRFSEVSTRTAQGGGVFGPIGTFGSTAIGATGRATPTNAIAKPFCDGSITSTSTATENAFSTE